ncbi:MAG: DDE-type integrase/transposase/recombinase [archaeon]
MSQQIRCIHCKATNYTKKGFRKTENRGKIQKYQCTECGQYFTNDEGFYRMRNCEKIVTMSVDMYLSNLSSRKMRNQLKRHMDTKISHVSVLDWVRKYVLKVQHYIEKFTPKLSGKFYVDETDIPRGCNTKKKGGDKFWCCVDWETRYINATMYSPKNQSVAEATRFLKKTVKHGKPKFIQTDAAKFYPKAMRRCFSTNTTKGFTIGGEKRIGVEHRINNVSKTKKHNVRIETVFSKIKDRVDDFRGIKALWSAPILLAGIVLQHNFIEAHTTTGAIPSELAGIGYQTGENRWLELIRVSAYS